ncbi:Plug domain-containing protein [Niabella aquatica]
MLLFLSGWAVAQPLAQRLEDFATKFSPERAYLHYDKSSYFPGETIWFKAYVLNEVAPALESKNFYVDWIDDQGQILKHTVAPLIDGVTNGQFDIPADFKGRYIAVKAYTRWMLNFDSSFLYKKAIQLLNKDSLKLPPTAVIKPVLEFFPESGDLIAGFPNKVAFKATDQWGRPVKIKGIVSGSNGKIADSLRVQHDGMGFILLNPVPGAAFTAKWKDEQGKEYTTTLPAVKSSGANIQVKVLPGRREFRVGLSPDLAAASDSVYLIGSMFQHPVFTIAKSVKGEITGIVPTTNLPYGVLTITLLDKNWKPLAERITYIDNNAPFMFTPAMEVQRWGLSYRARNEVKITIPENTGASLSVAVTDLSIDADSSDNILSTLMLSSDLKGKVYNAAYYFTNPDDVKQQHLDLVMLTNGWRRIHWQQIASGTLPKINYPRDTSYLSLSGTVQGIMPGLIGDGAAAMMIVTQKDQQNKMLLVPVQRNGTFNDPSVILFDTAQVYYQFQDKNLNGAIIQFMPHKLRTPSVGKGYNNLLWPDTAGLWRHLQLAMELNDNTQKARYKELETVTVKAKAKSAVEQMDEKYASGLFSGGDAIQIDVLNDPFAKTGDVFMFLQGKVAGLQINGQGSGASLSWRGGAPQIYVDEVPSDVSMVSSINVNDIAYIKAFRPPFMGGFNGSNGAIAIYTRRGDDAKRDAGAGIPSSRVEGYTGIREFYSPKYLTTEPAPGADRDVRTTLYWNPNVSVDPRTKQAVISFYNNDVTDAFRVVIEGMTTDGKLAHLEERME